MDSFGFGLIVCCFAVVFLFLGAYAANNGIDDIAKKEDCEQSLILRAHECTLY